MAKFASHRAGILLGLIAMGFGFSAGFPSRCFANTSTTAAPEVDLYLTHNHIFGSRLIAIMNYQDTTSRWTNGYFEYTVDVGLKSFFRRYVYKDPNIEKTKHVLMRLGYAYFPDYTDGEGAVDEKRALSELTFRVPMGGKWLWTDQNKGEVRWMSTTTSGRYRNRLKLERGTVIRGLRATPYIVGEGFYDIPTGQWNRFSSSFGIEFPWKYSMIIEPSFSHTAVLHGSPAETIGLTIQKHMAMPIGGTQ